MIKNQSVAPVVGFGLHSGTQLMELEGRDGIMYHDLYDFEVKDTMYQLCQDDERDEIVRLLDEIDALGEEMTEDEWDEIDPPYHILVDDE